MSEDLAVRRLRAQATLVSAAAGLIVATTALALLFFARPLVLERWGRSATDWLGALLLAVQVVSAAAGWWAATELGVGPSGSLGGGPTPPPAVDTQGGEEREPSTESVSAAPGAETKAGCPAPVMPLAERVVAIPLVGSLDRERILAVQGALLHGIERRRARVALIDLAGAVELAPQAVDAFGQLLGAIRLIGCQVVLTGVHGQVARTLLENGPELAIETRRDLRAGLDYALNRAEPGERGTAPSSWP
jgi:anti-anti-sigma regulatory factor